MGKNALVLSGGGAYGLSHIGAIKLFEEIGFVPDIIVGSSMGALIGALYSCGFNSKYMESIAVSFDTKLLLDFISSDKKRRRGLLQGDHVLNFLKLLTKNRTFNELDKQLFLNAADFFTGEEVLINEGSVAEAVRASVSVPWVFEPYKIGDRLLIDGSVSDPLPVNIAKKQGVDKIISVGFSEYTEDLEMDARAIYEKKMVKKNIHKIRKNLLKDMYCNDELNNKPRTVSVLEEGFVQIENMMDIVFNATLNENKKNSDLYIYIDLKKFSRMDFRKADKIINKGYKETKKYKDELIKLLDL
ncbi:MAG: hypothetical protein GX287_01060 [Fusobacteria bacterium]|nr:hypothetical protein [Fusobacteriota bacterium]